MFFWTLDMSERHYGYHEIMKLMTLFLSILLFSPFDFSLPSFFFFYRSCFSSFHCGLFHRLWVLRWLAGLH